MKNDRPIVVLVTGGSGYLGSRLLQFLGARSEFLIRAVSRNAHFLKSYFDNIEVIEDYIDSAECDFHKLLHDVDVVIHLAAINETKSEISWTSTYEFNTIASIKSW